MGHIWESSGSRHCMKQLLNPPEENSISFSCVPFFFSIKCPHKDAVPLKENPTSAKLPSHCLEWRWHFMHVTRHQFSKAKPLASLMMFLSTLCGPAFRMSVPGNALSPFSFAQGQEKLEKRLLLSSLITWRNKTILILPNCNNVTDTCTNLNGSQYYWNDHVINPKCRRCVSSSPLLTVWPCGPAKAGSPSTAPLLKNAALRVSAVCHKAHISLFAQLYQPFQMISLLSCCKVKKENIPAFTGELCIHFTNTFVVISIQICPDYIFL